MGIGTPRTLNVLSAKLRLRAMNVLSAKLWLRTLVNELPENTTAY
jgi:hypothetical protein